MPFIGKLPDVGAFRLIDSITTSATDTYALQVEGLSYFPSSARNLIVSLNGVTQAPESAYTVSGSNIIFDSALTASDVIDYILVIGESVDIGTPSDNTVGNAQLKSDLDFSGKTLTFSADQISGDAINGGTISSFASTGIDDNATSTAITIDSSENVGIGTTDPEYALEIEGSAKEFRITDTGANNTYASVKASPNNAQVVVARQGAQKSRAELRALGNSAYLELEGLADDVAVLASESNGDLSISLDDGVTDTEFMRFDASSGNVGIGTTSPARHLHVNSGSAQVTSIFQSTGASSYLDFANSTTAQGRSRIGAEGTDTLVFKTEATERMRITSSGDLHVSTLGSKFTLGLELNSSAHGDFGIKASTPRLTFEPTADGQSSRVQFCKTDGTLWGSIYGFNDTEIMQFTADVFTFKTSSTERMRVDLSGNLFVGCDTTPSATVHGFAVNPAGVVRTSRNGTAAASHYIFYNDNGQVGDINTSGTATAYNITSDQRLKENIADAPAGNIDAIRVRSFDWKADGTHQTYGMVAQELIDVAPEAVSQGETEDDMWGVDYSKLVPMMIKEIQDLKAEVAALKGE